MRLADRRERDDTASEAGTGQPCAGGAGPAECVDERIQLGCRDLEVVAQAGVARRHQRSKLIEVAATQSVGRLEHAGVLEDDVPRPGLVGHLLGGRVSQRCQTKPGRDGFARCAALRVRAVLERAGSPEWTTTMATSSGSLIGSTSSERQSIRSAQPARPAREVS